MARLIVNAVSAESAGSNIAGEVQLYVSVSRADDGKPVTGLTKDNFRLASSVGLAIDTTIASCSESNWEPADNEPSGCYQLGIKRSDSQKWGQGLTYQFGVQARTLNGKVVVDCGQTAADLKVLFEP